MRDITEIKDIKLKDGYIKFKYHHKHKIKIEELIYNCFKISRENYKLNEKLEENEILIKELIKLINDMGNNEKINRLKNEDIDRILENHFNDLNGNNTGDI